MKAISLLLILGFLASNSNLYAQPIGSSITFEILEDDTAIALNKPIRGRYKNPKKVKLGKYEVEDQYHHKYYRGFGKVLNCNTCFKKTYPIPGHDYELISIINTTTKETMNILVTMGKSNFMDAYLGINFKPGDYVFVFEEDFDWWKYSVLDEKEKQWFKFKADKLLGLNITPPAWENHAVDLIDVDSVYSENRLKVYYSPDTTSTEPDGISLEGTYSENSQWGETDYRLAHMTVGETIELAIKIQNEDEISYQYLSGSSLVQIEDSLFMFRGDSSWKITSINIPKRMKEDPLLYYNYSEEPMDDHSLRITDSCANFNPFENKGLLDTKIQVSLFPDYDFRALVAELFDTFQVKPIKAGEEFTYKFADIAPHWWCENLSIPVTDVEGSSIKLAAIDPIDHLPIKLLFNQGWRHTLGFGIADSRVKGQNRVGLYLKVMSDGKLQVSYQHPKYAAEYSIMAVLELTTDKSK